MSYGQERVQVFSHRWCSIASISAIISHPLLFSFTPLMCSRSLPVCCWWSMTTINTVYLLHSWMHSLHTFLLGCVMFVWWKFLLVFLAYAILSAWQFQSSSACAYVKIPCFASFCFLLVSFAFCRSFLGIMKSDARGKTEGKSRLSRDSRLRRHHPCCFCDLLKSLCMLLLSSLPVASRSAFITCVPKSHRAIIRWWRRKWRGISLSLSRRGKTWRWRKDGRIRERKKDGWGNGDPSSPQSSRRQRFLSSRWTEKRSPLFSFDQLILLNNLVSCFEWCS